MWLVALVDSHTAKGCPTYDNRASVSGEPPGYLGVKAHDRAYGHQALTQARVLKPTRQRSCAYAPLFTLA